MARIAPSSCLAVLVLGVLSMAIPGGVVIEFRMEGRARSGQASPLTVSIQKGGLDYFGRILLLIPEDCQLTPRKLNGGSFAWDEEQNRAVVSWLKLPEEDRFDLEFDLKIAPDAPPGTREVVSEFSFIRNQDRASVAPPPFLFDVQASDDRAPSASSTPPASTAALHVSATRMCEEKDNEHRITLQFDGMDGVGFTKVTERIPSGCDWQVLEDGGGTVQTLDEGFSIVWFDAPPNAPVIYRLGQCPLSVVHSVTGSLSVIHDGDSEEVPVIPCGLERFHDSATDDAHTGKPVISFEVQVAATKNGGVTDYFKEKFNFRLETKEEKDGDWWKYTTGHHEEYASAKSLRNDIREEFPFHGPFVIARAGGRRISVQEALTRTGQRWTP